MSTFSGPARLGAVNPVSRPLKLRYEAAGAATVIRANSAGRCVGLDLSGGGTGAALTGSARFAGRRDETPADLSRKGARERSMPSAEEFREA